MSESVLIKNAYCKERPNCTLKGIRCMTCEYGKFVTVSFKVAYALVHKDQSSEGKTQ